MLGSERSDHRPRQPPRWGTIGIVGGMGHVSTIHFYSMIVRLFQERRGAVRNDDYPRICVHGIADADNVESLGDGSLYRDLAEAVGVLTREGCDFVCIPCNTVHNLLGDAQARSPVPVLDTVALTVDAVAQRDVDSVLLLATARTIANRLYHEPLRARGIATRTPPVHGQAALNSVILGVNGGRSTDELLPGLLDVVAESPPADCIVLGCTELSPFSSDLAAGGLQVVDSLWELAEDAFRRASERGIAA